jgi:hypothetical protein
MADEYESFADRAENYAACPAGLVADLSESQKADLHTFKRAFATHLRQLYRTVPELRADQVLGPLLKRLGDSV